MDKVVVKFDKSNKIPSELLNTHNSYEIDNTTFVVIEDKEEVEGINKLTEVIKSSFRPTSK